MKVKIKINDGDVSISNGVLTLKNKESKKEQDFCVHLDEMRNTMASEIIIGAPPHGVSIEITNHDRVIGIKEDRLFHEGGLFITRWKLLNGELVDEEYLAKNGKWTPRPEGYSLSPPNALIIPISK